MSPSVTWSEKPTKPLEAAPPGIDRMFSAARGVMRKTGSASANISTNRQSAAAGSRRYAREPARRSPFTLRRKIFGSLATSIRLSLAGAPRPAFLISKQTTASSEQKT